MQQKDFSNMWISWTQGRVSNPKFSIFINEGLEEECSLKRGIGQGDPLFPFLFLLISEVLSALIENACSKGVYEGFVVGKDIILVPLLQFADDTLFFVSMMIIV